jgi:adenosylcobinamide amidohydrolase
MNPVLLANLLAELGTVGIPLIIKLKTDIEASKTATTVTDADLAELARLSSLTSASIFAAAGVTPPSAPSA